MIVKFTSDKLKEVNYGKRTFVCCIGTRGLR